LSPARFDEPTRRRATPLLSPVDLTQPPELIAYLGKRNVGIFSADMDSFDFKMRKPEQVRAHDQ
jgi:hypothetical protein